MSMIHKGLIALALILLCHIASGPLYQNIQADSWLAGSLNAISQKEDLQLSLVSSNPSVLIEAKRQRLPGRATTATGLLAGTAFIQNFGLPFDQAQDQCASKSGPLLPEKLWLKFRALLL